MASSVEPVSGSRAGRRATPFLRPRTRSVNAGPGTTDVGQPAAPGAAEKRNERCAVHTETTSRAFLRRPSTAARSCCPRPARLASKLGAANLDTPTQAS